MPFVKADLDREKAELDRLISKSKEARTAHEEFQARIALQQQLVQMRKAENMTQADVAKATGLSQQAVSRIEKGTGATISSLLKYLMGIGYGIELKKL
jgi:DNA-binding XRE family transcriptional regulator